MSGPEENPTTTGIAKLYAKVGNTTFGGGDPTTAALHRELTERRRWLTQEGFGLAFAMARVTPGTNVLAFCAASGYLLLGWVGAVTAVLSASIPSAVLTVWLTVAFETAERNPIAQSALSAVLATVAGMMVAAVYLLTKPFWKRTLWPRALLIVGGTFLLREALHWGPTQIIAAAALVGCLWPEPAEASK